MASWFDAIGLPGGVGGVVGAVSDGMAPLSSLVHQSLGGFAQPAWMRGSPGDRIAEMYRRVSGGTYTPTQQDIAQFGPNPDAQYLQKIAPAIQQWWDQNKAQNPTGAQPGTVYGPSAPYQPPGGGPGTFGGARFPSGYEYYPTAPTGSAPGGIAPLPQGGGMVLLRSPTGQMRSVPADQVEFFLARGAMRA